VNIAMRVVLLTCLAIAGARAADRAGGKSIYVVTYVDVIATAVPQATALLKAYSTATRHETGALGVDLYEQHGRPSGFALVESWRNRSTFEAHSKGPAVLRLTQALQSVQAGPWDVRAHTAYSLGDLSKQRDHAITLLVHVDVAPPFLSNYEQLLPSYLTAARRDPGLERLDVLEGTEPRINHFTVIERWDDDAAIEAHQRATHTQEYRSALTPLLGALYDERAYHRVQ
jgi:quinol monooxygenase YgiN